MALRDRIPQISFRSSQTDRTEMSASDAARYSAVTTYYMILVPAVILASFGVLMMFSATAVTNISNQLNPYLAFARSLLIIVASIGVAVVCALIAPKRWFDWSWWIFVGALILQSMIMVSGIASGGNTNWVVIPGTGQAIQPSEFLKLATCLFLGRVLANLGSKIGNWKQTMVGVGIPSLAAIGAVMLGGDLGTALIFVAITLGALWVAGAPAKWFPIIGLVMGFGAAILVAANQSRVRRIIEALPGFGTEPDTTAPTQTDHALWALGSGGLIGLGPGASREKWNYLQEASTDFIFAIVGEEFGLVGTLSLLVAIGVLVWGILRLSSNSNEAFVRVTAGGVASWLIFQSLINVGMVIGLTPVIGVPFPLVSYGGSSFLFTAMAIGVLLSFARFDAGMARGGQFDAETGGRDPRVAPRRRQARRTPGESQ